MAQQLVEGRRVGGAHLLEGVPEVAAAITGLHARSGHVQLGALEDGLHAGRVAVLCHGDLLGEAIAGGLHGVGTLGTVEINHVVAEQIGIRQQGVIGGVVLGGSADHQLGLLKGGVELLQLLLGLVGLPRLVQEGILQNAGIAVQQRGGLGAEVLQDLKTFVADLTEIRVACRRRLGLGLRAGLRGHGRGIGRRLWG